MSGSTPGLTYGYVPTAGEWNYYFAQKQDWSSILDGIIATGGSPAATPIAPFTPTDTSGAALTFSGVSAEWQQVGNQVQIFLSVTYPTTSNSAAASIGSFPIAVPTSAYALVAAATVNNATTAINAVTSLGHTYCVLQSPTGTAITNATLSGKTISFTLIYPAA